MNLANETVKPFRPQTSFEAEITALKDQNKKLVDCLKFTRDRLKRKKMATEEIDTLLEGL